MSNKKQTAVEWLVDQYEQTIGISITKVMSDEIATAREMDKQQKKEDFIAGMEFIAVDPSKYEEDAIELIAAKIQKQCHDFANAIIKQKPEVSHQDATNVFIFRELSKLQIRLSIAENGEI